MSKKNTRRQNRKKNQQTNKVKEMKKVNATHTTWKKPVTPPCHTGQNKIFTTTTDKVVGGRWTLCPAWLLAQVKP